MYLGIDIGTSAVKVVCLDGADLLGSASASLSTSSPRPGWSEQNPEIWWRATCAALAELGQSVLLGDVKAVGLSGQMHGAVLLDAELQPIRPAILWNDSRATRECDLLQEDQPDIGQQAGILPLPGFTAPKLLWMQRHEFENYARIAHVLLPKDYVGLRLHGQLATDTSDAAGTLWLDQASRSWDARLAKASATRPDWLPQLYAGHEIVGAVTVQAAADSGLSPGTPVVAGGGDAATGAVSLGATEPGRGFISLGTSGQLFVADRTYRPNPGRYVHAFAHTLPGRWYQMAAMLNGARPISWVGGQLGLSAADVVALAETADTARVPIFLPYLTGERSPHGDPHIRAGFFGLEDATSRAEICRAVIEAIAFCFADAADSFGDTLPSLTELYAIGGGSRSDLLLRLIATVTGKSIIRSDGADSGPAMGAARLAACGVGALNTGDLAEQPDRAEIFEPEEMADLSDRLSRFRALYGALRNVR